MPEETVSVAVFRNPFAKACDFCYLCTSRGKAMCRPFFVPGCRKPPKAALRWAKDHSLLCETWPFAFLYAVSCLPQCRVLPFKKPCLACRNARLGQAACPGTTCKREPGWCRLYLFLTFFSSFSPALPVLVRARFLVFWSVGRHVGESDSLLLKTWFALQINSIFIHLGWF